MNYFLSLGSNLGDRRKNINQAINFLRSKGRLLKVSSIYRTSPVLMSETNDFFNAVVALDSTLMPEDFLKEIKNYERCAGRDIMNSRCKPRIIDIDILLADNTIIQSERLTIPHPEMTKRAFVLVPLSEIAPECIHPLAKQSIAKLLSGLISTESVEKEFQVNP